MNRDRAPLRRKIGGRFARATSPRAPLAASSRAPTAYASIVSRARALLGVATITLAPLGALVGNVAACGGCPPVDPRVYDDAGADGEASPHLAAEPLGSASIAPMPENRPPRP